MSPCILILACDPYLAGIYGRKFERDHWEVIICETIADALQKISLKRPDTGIKAKWSYDFMPGGIVDFKICRR